MTRIAIVGGGITGLAAAHRLYELCPNFSIDLLESSSDVGGVLRSERNDQFLFEHSADMFTTLDKSAIELCERIGFVDQLIGTNQTNQRAFIAQGNDLVPVPRGLNLMTPSDLDAIRETDLLSDEGKKRFLEEETIPPKPEPGDESLQAFAIRRFGQEAYRKIIQPLVGGIYTADPTRLSLKATLPQYLQMESEHGSVIAATRKRVQGSKEKDKSTSGARYNLFMAPKNGMSSLIEALKSRIKSANFLHGRQVANLVKTGNDWRIEFANGAGHSYDAVILTCPAEGLTRMLAKGFGKLSELLGQIQYASSAILVQGYERNQIGHPLNGFGFVVPLAEKRKILAGSFSSIKFAGRCSDDLVLTRTFVGGGCQPELMNHTDPELTELASKELGELLQISGEPRFEQLVRWDNSMPQYHLGHLDWVKKVEEMLESEPGLEIAGKSFRGVGIPACIRSGETAAEKIATLFS